MTQNNPTLEAALSRMISDLSADMSDNPATRREELETIKAALHKTYTDGISMDDWVDAATVEAKIGL